MATSFDSATELNRKFPETNHYLKELKKAKSSNLNVSVLNDIDATKLQLYDRLFQEALGIDVVRFDEIIFNFPHLGFENMTLHQALIAHIMYRYDASVPTANSLL